MGEAGGSSAAAIDMSLCSLHGLGQLHSQPHLNPCAAPTRQRQSSPHTIPRTCSCLPYLNAPSHQTPSDRTTERRADVAISTHSSSISLRHVRQRQHQQDRRELNSNPPSAPSLPRLNGPLLVTAHLHLLSNTPRPRGLPP